MGEHCYFGDAEIKIGTCENMYYLRADQMDLVHGGDWPANRASLGVIRFRFPFPDEDGIAPGSFEDYNRGLRIPDYSLPATLSGDTHNSLQFHHDAGYLVCLPCPEQFGQPGMSVDMPNGLRVARNGFRGGPVIRQQAFRGGALVTIVSCGSCGALHRLDTIEDARPVVDALRAEAARTDYRDGKREDRYPVGNDSRRLLEETAKRIEDGYAVTVPS